MNKLDYSVEELIKLENLTDEYFNVHKQKTNTKQKIHNDEKKRGNYTPVKRQKTKKYMDTMRTMFYMQKKKGKRMENENNRRHKSKQKRKNNNTNI